MKVPNLVSTKKAAGGRGGWGGSVTHFVFLLTFPPLSKGRERELSQPEGGGSRAKTPIQAVHIS